MSTAPQRPTLRVFRRPGCHLCDEARILIQAALEERAVRGDPIPAVREIDVEGDPALEARYGVRIPVLELNGIELELATSARQIRTFLDRALGRLA